MTTNPPPCKVPKCDATFKCVKDLQRILECPVCLLTPENSTQAHFCSNGHMICGGCRVKVQNCPVCQSENLDGQNHLLGQILAAIPKRCPFEGCDAEPKDDELEEHKKTCQYRLIDCITHSICGCKEKVPFNSFFEHLKDKHKVSHLYQPNQCTWKLSETDFDKQFISWLPHVTKFDGKTFIVAFTKNNNLFHSQCILYGNETDAKKYAFEAKSKDFPNNGFILTGEVISVDVKRSEYEKGDYFDNCIFSKSLGKKLWKKHGIAIPIEYTIKKIL